MTHSRPRILVTARRPQLGADKTTIDRVARSIRYYVDAVRDAGGEPIVVRAGDPMPADYDGLLLSGGADVHPRYYGEVINESVRDTLSIDDARDAMEMTLAQSALEADLPMLCICRGIQLINVAAGGTLWQDLSLATVDPVGHFQEGRLETWEAGHDVAVDAGTRLAEIMGDGSVGVNSYHHQAVREPAPGFCVVARAEDGTVEGIESERHSCIIGVQWHPERMVSHHPLQRRLFSRLVEAARRRSKSQTA
ncbi:MAG TPA: gamma-glutamyl-gamma-aminobutyrate hydrolase family protein [bacterium]|nr:gamma-glutamyl-gamma-aminobutyrate hydrolase family protein [bacterium]